MIALLKKVLPSFFSHRCVCCSLPTNGKLFHSAHAFLCLECIEYFQSTPHHISNNNTPFNSIFAFAIYEGILQDIIPQYKYDHMLHYAPLLADLLILTSKQYNLTDYDYCIPIPQHLHKARKRRFYHLGLIADYLHKNYSFPLSHTILSVNTLRVSQQGLSRNERLENIKGIFTLNTNVTHKRILLLDDVITTGSTLATVAQLLRDAGAKHIDCLAIAINKRGIVANIT